MHKFLKPFLKAIGVGFIFASATISAYAADEVFECDAIGDGHYIVAIPGGNAREAWAYYKFGSNPVNPRDGMKMLLVSDDFYEGKDTSFTYGMRQGLLSDLNASIAVQCYRNDRLASPYSGTVAQKSSKTNLHPAGQKGKALGGNMRTGPGTKYAKKASVGAGTNLTIIGNSGVRLDGYDWFEVQLNNGNRGFIWGGILCSEGQRLDGILYACSEWQASTQRFEKQYSGGWMAFAIGENGRWGHGAANTQYQARQFALDNCGSGCRIDNETQDRCHAIATVPGAFWYGTADTQSKAENFAFGFCNAIAKNCRVEYSYCR